MSLQDALQSIVTSLRENRFPNEQAVSQGVVLRVLHELGWNPWDPQQVWPEYSLGGAGRVDFALCFPAQNPVVFVEAKQPGRADGGDQQLFEYAFHRGVQMALLQARLNTAREAGCDIAITLTTPGSASQRNVERAGFSLAYTRAIVKGD